MKEYYHNSKLIIFSVCMMILLQVIIPLKIDSRNLQETPPSSSTVDPSQPSPSVDPVSPSQPSPSDVPVSPSQPSPSDVPVSPSQPLPSDAPVSPSQPSPSDAPVSPSQPSPSGTPVNPDIVDPSKNSTGQPYEDVFVIPIYQSNLTQEQKDEYLFWVKYKNSFNTNEGQLAKLTKYFAPENEDYFTTIFRSGWFFFTLAGIFAFSLLAYLILRFVFKRCLGPKQHITVWFGYFSYSLIGVGFCIAIIFFSISLSNSSSIHSSVTLTTDRIAMQAQMMKDYIFYLEKNQSLLAANLGNNTEYKSQIFAFDDIKNETLRYANLTADFGTEIDNRESSRFSYEIACMVMIPVLTIAAIVFFKLKKSSFILIISIFLFALLIPASVIMGLNTGYFLLSIDYCKDVNKFVTTGVKPIREAGIGVYVSCPSKNIQKAINTANYELGLSFNRLINEVNATIMKNDSYQNLGIYKRNNEHFKELAYKRYINNTEIFRGLHSIIFTNNLLRDLSAIAYCQSAFDIINYSEENFCYENITYQFNNLIYYFIGIFGLLLLSIGVNKLIVLLNPAFLKLTKTGMELLNENSIN